jgi:hypothetical protein
MRGARSCQRPGCYWGMATIRDKMGHWPSEILGQGGEDGFAFYVVPRIVLSNKRHIFEVACTITRFSAAVSDSRPRTFGRCRKRTEFGIAARLRTSTMTPCANGMEDGARSTRDSGSELLSTSLCQVKHSGRMARFGQNRCQTPPWLRPELERGRGFVGKAKGGDAGVARGIF